MPLGKFVLVLVCVLFAALLTVWVGALLVASAQLPWLGLAVLIPVGLIAYVVVRVITDRLRSSEDDRYDRVPR